MRPVVRGELPKDAEGNQVTFKSYQEARGPMILRIGAYCSYCEIRLPASLAVEHVKPKKPDGVQMSPAIADRELDWHNFLLACASCNSIKSNHDVQLDAYVWPDKDNTYRAFTYSEGGTIKAALDGELLAKANAMIELVGLDRNPGEIDMTKDEASDRRWLNRRDTWQVAQRSKENLAKCNALPMRKQIVETALKSGHWSIWMTVFADDSDMRQRFLTKFIGTAVACFDSTGNAMPRVNGQC